MITPGQEDRAVVPRWRPLDAAVETGELGVHRGQQESHADVDSDLSEESTAFEADRGPFTAANLLSSALVSGKRSNLLDEAAEYLRAFPRFKAVADRYSRVDHDGETDLSRLPGWDVSAWGRFAGATRALVRREPRNAVRWVDLALAEVNLGELHRAERSMRVALQLQPRNRFIVRSAVRMFVLLDDVRTAQAVLRAAPSDDPWIASTDVAVATLGERAPIRIKDARRLIGERTFAPRDISELSAALATLEMRNGSRKTARKLVWTAMEDPTENAVAQIGWLSRNGLGEPRTDLDISRSHEAEAVALAYAADFAGSLREGLRWLDDQPFAPQPAVFTSFIASTCLEDHELAARIARKGLLSNPSDQMLRNNLAFALASCGETERAAGALTDLVLPTDAARRSAITATRGLIAFRSGDVDAGRSLYRQAVDGLAKVRDVDRASIACLYWAREEFLHRTLQAPTVLAEAETYVARASAAEVNAVHAQTVGILGRCVL